PAGLRLVDEADVEGVALEAARPAVGDEVEPQAVLARFEDADPHHPGVPAAIAAFAGDVDRRLAQALADPSDAIGLLVADAVVLLDVLQRVLVPGQLGAGALAGLLGLEHALIVFDALVPA